ncbi:polysaccharide deacetylase family protein [Dehalobacterium formicoaceticum]|uniref:Polysaccharide deacetylase family protein n=1 Tax=Dehalobacterium formicoaceticum TaxID=51515 RepID=A0ABT1Y666_9FIRM|nr:polysaccharide deacetylase family protein [Dehalobacterium formicoaceticum]MCR6546377.1 polysaccharide deacetylase family protein [Dehalobacterium formicoaceticum]
MVHRKSVWIFGFVFLILILFLAINNLHRGVMILHYHAVNNDKSSSEKLIRVYPQELAWQMNYLKKAGYHVVTLDKAVDYLKNGSKLPFKSVAITFDDGYEDNLTFALPVLRKYHYPATIFIPTGEIGGTNSWDRERVQSMKLLNWSQMETMQKEGVSFQDHTVHHLNITKISQEKAIYELTASKDVLEKHLKTNIDYFAYPFGSLHQNAVELVQKAGYKAAFTSSPGTNVYGKTDLFRIRRMSVKEMHGGFWGRLLFVLELKFSFWKI